MYNTDTWVAPGGTAKAALFQIKKRRFTLWSSCETTVNCTKLFLISMPAFSIALDTVSKSFKCAICNTDIGVVEGLQKSSNRKL